MTQKALRLCRFQVIQGYDLAKDGYCVVTSYITSGVIIALNDTFLYPARSMYLLDRRIRYRDKALRVYCNGRGIRYTFNTIKLDIVEV